MICENGRDGTVGMLVGTCVGKSGVIEAVGTCVGGSGVIEAAGTCVGRSGVIKAVGALVGTRVAGCPVPCLEAQPDELRTITATRMNAEMAQCFMVSASFISACHSIRQKLPVPSTTPANEKGAQPLSSLVLGDCEPLN